MKHYILFRHDQELARNVFRQVKFIQNEKRLMLNWAIKQKHMRARPGFESCENFTNLMPLRIEVHMYQRMFGMAY